MAGWPIQSGVVANLDYRFVCLGLASNEYCAVGCVCAQSLEMESVMTTPPESSMPLVDRLYDNGNRDLSQAADMEIALRALIDEQTESLLKDAGEPVVISAPTYHHEAMGCGLEDRGIHDRYDAMYYGWSCGIDRMFEQIPDEPIFTLPPSTAALQARIEQLTGRKFSDRMYPAMEAKLQVTQAEPTQALTRLEAAEKDAERYRWLRSQHENGESACTFSVFAPDSDAEDEATLYPVGCLPGELDTAIDTALATERSKTS